MPRKPPPASPFAGVSDYSPEDVSALQALDSGRDVPAFVARRAVTFIIETLAAAYDQSYRPGSDGERDTAFVEGRRFVGLQMLKLLKLNTGRLKTHGRSSDGRDPGRSPDTERKPGP